MLLPKRQNWHTMTSFHIDYVDIPSAGLQFTALTFHRVPVLTPSSTDLERLPKMSPKISILYSVSSVRSVIVALRSSPPSTCSLGWPGPSAWLTIMTKVSKASSSAIQASLKLSGVTSETRRACTSGSASEWQGKVSFPPLWEECFDIWGTRQWKRVYQSFCKWQKWRFSICQQIKSLRSEKRRVFW